MDGVHRRKKRPYARALYQRATCRVRVIVMIMQETQTQKLTNLVTELTTTEMDKLTRRPLGVKWVKSAVMMNQIAKC